MSHFQLPPPWVIVQLFWHLQHWLILAKFWDICMLAVLIALFFQLQKNLSEHLYFVCLFFLFEKF